MKCALIFLSLVALGCAELLPREAYIRTLVADDGTISIYGTSGNKLVISRVWQHAGPRNVEVFAGFEHGTVKKIFLEQETTLELVDAQHQTGWTEADVLFHIFKNYQRDIDMYTFTHLLKQVYVQVQSGRVSMSVYNILKSFIAQEASWKKFTNSETTITDYLSPQWYSLYNRLGFKNTGLGYTQEDFSNFEGPRSDYYFTEPRTLVGQPEYLRKMISAHYQPIQQQEGYMWQQPIYQKVQTKWYPQQFNAYTNYVNAPFVY